MRPHVSWPAFPRLRRLRSGVLALVRLRRKKRRDCPPLCPCGGNRR